MTSDSSKNGGRLLDGIRGPDDIKAIREQDLPQLAQEVRNKLIQVLSQTGGHLGPDWRGRTNDRAASRFQHPEGPVGF